MSPADVWMVGDGPYDVEAAIAAGVPSIWLSLGRPRLFSAEPSWTISSLGELQTLLMSRMSPPIDERKTVKEAADCGERPGASAD